MAHVDPETLESLNALLQDVRASVEVEVALSNGATERAERETLVSLGIEEVGLCCSLHDYLDAAGVFVTRHVNGIVLTIMSAEQYDERLHEFAMHQTASGQRAAQLGTVAVDPLLLRLLGDIHDAHVRSALWSEYRASQFAGSRSLEFRGSADVPSSTRESSESPSAGTMAAPAPAEANIPGTPVASSQPYDTAEGERNWPSDSYRSPAARDVSPDDDE